MNNFLRFISGGRIAPKIKIGQKWCLDNQINNPFDREAYTVVISEIKDGWVKYRNVVTGFVGEDTINHFRWLYVLLD